MTGVVKIRLSLVIRFALTKPARPTVIRGEVGNPIDPAPGCRFAPRCDFATEKCVGRNPELREVANGHFVACLLHNGEM